MKNEIARPIEKVLSCGRRRLPEMEGAGLLWWTLERNRLSFLERILPADFYQEAAAFLLGAPELPEYPKEDLTDEDRSGRIEFCRAAPRHFYKMATDYGYGKPKGSVTYVNRDVPVSTQQHDNETYAETQERLAEPSKDPLENLLEREEFEQLAHTSVDLNSREGRRIARAMLAYRDGIWREEKTLFTWCGLCSRELEFRGSTIDHIVPRSQGGRDTLDNLHLAHDACNQAKGDRLPPIVIAVEEALKKVQLPGPDDPPRRIVIGTPITSRLSLEEIQEMFGVVKSTAWRIKKRGWYWSGNFHKRPKLKKEVKKEKINLPDRIETAPDGRPVADMTVREIAETFGMSVRGSYRIKARGFLSTRQWPLPQKRHVAEILAQSLVAQERE